ncbi:MAG: ATP-binding protein [Deferribacteraceae bacterium]|jgi:ABC-type lipoprotein export system ATPase subunit|nr:ATP-binding protein [Deferribacteraceae bacterium]
MGELFLIGNVPALDLFWIAAQGHNDVCCHPLRSEWVLAFHDKFRFVAGKYGSGKSFLLQAI